MKREIKFRSWLPHFTEMFQPTDKCFKIFNDGSFSIDGLNCMDGVLMQYTGLKDKNGVEIYEGDIIENSNTERIGIVIYDHKQCYYNVSDKEQYNQGTIYNCDMLNVVGDDWMGWDIEVIGDIHENPELLK